MSFLEILKAVLFGIVEGIAEWLPISSTGHMIILEEIMPLKVSEAFYSLFEVVIQLGAIVAVIWVFWDKIWPFGKKDNREPAAEEGILSWVKMDKIRLWLKVAVACVPAAVVGVLFDDVFDRLFHNYVCVAVALIVFGVAFILVENYRRGRKPKIRSLDAIDYRTAALIGVFQLIAAIFPGTSRSGATIIGALLLGVSRRTSVQFTFIMAIPVMLGASLLKLIKYDQPITGAEWVILLAGMVTACVVSLLVIRKLLDYVRKHNFKGFGWYRIALGVVVLAFFTIRGMI